VRSDRGRRDALLEIIRSDAELSAFSLRAFILGLRLVSIRASAMYWCSIEFIAGNRCTIPRFSTRNGHPTILDLEAYRQPGDASIIPREGGDIPCDLPLHHRAAHIPSTGRRFFCPRLNPTIDRTTISDLVSSAAGPAGFGAAVLRRLGRPERRWMLDSTQPGGQIGGDQLPNRELLGFPLGNSVP